MLPEAARYKKEWQSAQQSRRDSGVETDSFVYLHVNADDGVPHHVGIGFKKGRPWETKRNNKHRSKVKKHGLRVEIVADNLTWEQACFWEVHWIKALRAAGYELTNLTDGGDGVRGYRHTEESKKIIGEKSKNYLNSLGDNHPSKRQSTKDKISKSREKYKGETHPMWGKSHKQETKDKISKSLSGENHPNFGKPCEAMLASLKENHPKFWLGKTGENHPAYQRPVSEKTRQILREKNTGKKHNDSTKEKVSKATSGSKNPRAKISEELAQKVLDFEGAHADAARFFNLPYNYTVDIRTGRSWKRLKPSRGG